LQPNVSHDLQDKYLNMLSLTIAGSSPPSGLMVSQRAIQNTQFQAVMAGINWKFMPGGSATPWTGGYAGIQGGGAWGNRTDATYDSVVNFSDARLKRDVILLGRRGDGLGIY